MSCQGTGLGRKQLTAISTSSVTTISRRRARQIEAIIATPTVANTIVCQGLDASSANTVLTAPNIPATATRATIKVMGRYVTSYMAKLSGALMNTSTTAAFDRNM